MIGLTRMPPPWRFVKQHGDFPVFVYPDGRYCVGVEKGLKSLLRYHGAQGLIIGSWVTDYVEGPTEQSAVDRAWIVQQALREVQGETREDEPPALIDAAPKPVPRILRRKRA